MDKAAANCRGVHRYACTLQAFNFAHTYGSIACQLQTLSSLCPKSFLWRGHASLCLRMRLIHVHVHVPLIAPCHVGFGSLKVPFGGKFLICILCYALLDDVCPAAFSEHLPRDTS